MIRHPFLIAAELLVAVAVALLGHLGVNKPQPKPKPLGFSLTALGEKEQPDGSWSGVDLLSDRGAHIDRFQLTVRPDQLAQLTIDVIERDGAHRLFPEPGQDGVIAPGKGYALPSPHAFYELEGEARVRVSVRSPGQPDAPLPPASAVAGVKAAAVRGYPLSDGTRWQASECEFNGPTGGHVDLTLAH